MDIALVFGEAVSYMGKIAQIEIVVYGGHAQCGTPLSA